MIQIRRILCPVDLSDHSLRALAHASTLAGWYESSVSALYVETAPPVVNAARITSFGGAPTAVFEAPQSTRAVDDLRARVARAAKGRAVDLEMDDAPDVADAIVRRAVIGGADLIVMGTRGRAGMKRLFAGSVTERVLRTAPSPVLVIPPHDAVPTSTVSFKHIVAAIDFSDSSLAALQWALSLSEEADAHLWLLHAIEVPPELRAASVVTDQEVDELNAFARASALLRLRSLVPEGAEESCSIKTATTVGEASHALLKFAAEHEADLIVMGVQGHGAVDRLIFGSKTRDVVGAATCPVLTVRR